MKATRRTFLQTTAAAAALTQAPSVLRAQPAARQDDSRRDARGSARLRPDLDDGEHHRLPRLDDLRHAVRARREHEVAAADGVEIRRLGRQAHLHLRAARRLEVLRRLGRHLGRRRRLDPALGGARRRRPAHDAARQGHRQEGRQDLHHRAEGALRPRHRPDGEDHDAAPLHHAQEGGRDRSDAAGDDLHRLRSLHLQPGPDEAGRPLRLRQEPELRAAPGRADRACRRQGREGRPRHLRQHATR